MNKSHKKRSSRSKLKPLSTIPENAEMNQPITHIFPTVRKKHKSVYEKNLLYPSKDSEFGPFPRKTFVSLKPISEDAEFVQPKEENPYQIIFEKLLELKHTLENRDKQSKELCQLATKPKNIRGKMNPYLFYKKITDLDARIESLQDEILSPRFKSELPMVIKIHQTTYPFLKYLSFQPNYKLENQAIDYYFDLN
jgi:hypothetical protein